MLIERISFSEVHACKFGGVELRTVNIEIWQRSRIWNPPEDEKFALRLKVYASQEEIEKIRATIFKLEKKEGA